MATFSSTTVAILRISGSTLSTALHCLSVAGVHGMPNPVSAGASQALSSGGSEVLTDVTTLRSVLMVNAFWQNLRD